MTVVLEPPFLDRPRREAPRAMATLTVVVPAYDEGDKIEAVVRRIPAEIEGLAEPLRVLILNDGSMDWTPQLQQRLEADERVTVRSFYPNSGKGAVLGRAFPGLETDLAVVIDADGEYAPEQIPDLLAPLLQGRADWVMGSRYGFSRRRPRQYLATYLVNLAINLWFRMLSGVRFRDLLTGLYAFRTELVTDLRLRERRFSYTPELIWRVQRRGGIRWCEVPIDYRFRGYGAGKKIRWWETGTILYALLRYRSITRRECRSDS